MLRRTALLLALAATLASPAAAWADGDPASDVLLSEDVFFPYAPNGVSAPMRAALSTTVDRAKAKGYAVKVALIADRRDLGSVGQLLTDPQGYANLLTSEISLNVTHGSGVAKPRVLVVLPTGLGGNNLGDTAGDALSGVVVDGEGSDALARTAAVAVGQLSAAAGRPIALPAFPGAQAAGGGGGIPAPIAYGAPVLLLVLALVAVNLRAGRGHDEPADDDAALA